MALKIGIYLGYGPGMNLRTEGLGRHLAEFLRVAAARDDLEVIVAAPSWLRKPLEDLLDAFGVAKSSLRFVGPRNPSWVLQLWMLRLAIRAAGKRPSTLRRGEGMRGKLAAVLSEAGRLGLATLVAPRNLLVGLLLVLLLLALALLALPLIAVLTALYLMAALIAKGRFRSLARRAAGVVRNKIGLRLYRAMSAMEAKHVLQHANRQEGVAAWYSPTAFWPEFNLIRAPRVICVPDVLPTGFPVGFSLSGGEGMAASVGAIERVIAGGANFITYSEEVKWGTLVDRFKVRPSKVHVVRHGANQLGDLVAVSGFPDNEEAARVLCGHHLTAAFAKCVNNPAAVHSASPDLAFLFYASQFRPNKNVVTLLRAFRYLRQMRQMPLKLVLTGNPAHDRGVAEFLDAHGLHDDVFCLHGLSELELASCYKLARTAINPSLMEGGMPFTFTEALSVGTPVVMSDIAVTREVMLDPDVRSVTLFDPHDWQSMAERIERTLADRAGVLAVQLPSYHELAARGWAEAVGDYIEVLRKVSISATTSIPSKSEYGKSAQSQSRDQ